MERRRALFQRENKKQCACDCDGSGEWLELHEGVDRTKMTTLRRYTRAPPDELLTLGQTAGQ